MSENHVRELFAGHDPGDEPPLRPGLLESALSNGRRRNRHRWYATAAGVAAIAVMVGSLIAVGAVSEQPDRRDRKGIPLPPAAGEALSPDDLWPGGYHEIPRRLPDGREYQAWLLLNDHDLLVTTAADDTNYPDTDPGEVWLIDLNTKKARQFMALPKLETAWQSQAQNFTVGSGHLVWWDSYEEGDSTLARIWKAPLDTAKPSLVTTVTTGRYGIVDGGVIGDRLAVDGDTIYFNDMWNGGVRKVPLAGGEAQPVAGTEDYRHIVAWPWVGKPALWEACTANTAERCLDPTRQSDRLFTDLLNVKSGETSSAKVPDGVHHVTCGVSYCTGLEGTTALVWTRDGGKQRELATGVRHVFGPPALDRFVVTVSADDGPLVHDLKTGRSAAFDGVGDGLRPDGRLLTGVVDQDTVIVVDLAAVE